MGPGRGMVTASRRHKTFHCGWQMGRGTFRPSIHNTLPHGWSAPQAWRDMLPHRTAELP